MNDLFKKIYEKVIYYSKEYITAGKRLDEEVANLITLYRDRLNEQEIEELQNLIYTASYTAQYEGFLLGIKATIKALVELLSD